MQMKIGQIPQTHDDCMCKGKCRVWTVGEALLHKALERNDPTGRPHLHSRPSNPTIHLHAVDLYRFFALFKWCWGTA